MIELDSTPLNKPDKIDLDEVHNEIKRMKEQIKDNSVIDLRKQRTKIVNDALKIIDRNYIKDKMIYSIDNNKIRLGIIEYKINFDDINVQKLLTNKINSLDINYDKLDMKDINYDLSITEMITNIIPDQYNVYVAPLSDQSYHRRYEIYIENGIRFRHPCSIFCCFNEIAYQYFCSFCITDPCCCLCNY